MNEFNFIDFSIMPAQALLKVVLFAIGVFMLLKLIKRYLFVLIRSEIWVNKVDVLWPRIELLAWLSVTIFSLVYLLNKSFFVTCALVVVLVVLGGKYWRDAVNGVLLRLENRVGIGDFLSNSTYDGVIQKMGFRGIQLRIDSGEVAFVPYSHISEFKVRKFERDEKSELLSFIINLKPSLTVDEALRVVKTELLQLPYTVLTKKVLVEISAFEKDKIAIRASLHTRSMDEGKMVQKALQQVLESENILVS